MKRVVLGVVVSLALTLLIALGVAEAQEGEGRARIGWLGSGYDVPGVGFGQFRTGLRSYGFRASFEVRFAYGRVERLPRLAAELVGREVDVLVVRDSPAAHAARQATRTVPIILAGVGDPVRQGLVDSLARPGGNVTGLSWGFDRGIACKWLQLLCEIDATLARVAFFWNSAEPTAAARVHELQGCARPLGVAVRAVDVRTAAPDLEPALTALSAEWIGGVIVDPFVEITREVVIYQIGSFVKLHRLPNVWPFTGRTYSPGLLEYGPPWVDVFGKAGIYAGKILTGTDPATLPIEQPRAYRLEVNLRAAKKRGVTIPKSILVWADRIVE